MQKVHLNLEWIYVNNLGQSDRLLVVGNAKSGLN